MSVERICHGNYLRNYQKIQNRSVDGISKSKMKEQGVSFIQRQFDEKILF